MCLFRYDEFFTLESNNEAVSFLEMKMANPRDW